MAGGKLVGGSAGSTAGGIKVFRIILLYKVGWAELKRAIHPKAVINIRFGKRTVDPVIINTVSVFFFLYFLHFCLCNVSSCCDGVGADQNNKAFAWVSKLKALYFQSIKNQVAWLIGLLSLYYAPHSDGSQDTKSCSL